MTHAEVEEIAKTLRPNYIGIGHSQFGKDVFIRYEGIDFYGKSFDEALRKAGYKYEFVGKYKIVKLTDAGCKE